MRQVNDFADDGNRVLLIVRFDGAASSDYETDPKLDSTSQPVALVLCSEHIRGDAEATLAWFREQGVRCRIISGDNPVTVGAIARKVRLTGEREPVFMDARELPANSEELARVLDDVDVLGRVLPDQKKAIVQALHLTDHVVAMTGDGVNDALAIKEADLGVAMGNAAPATKAVAQVVLVDSKFSHLPDVVARGRQVMANMERVASLFLVKTVYSALISLGVVLTQIPFPYLPRHITYIGGLTIGMPAFILALAPNTSVYSWLFEACGELCIARRRRYGPVDSVHVMAAADVHGMGCRAFERPIGYVAWRQCHHSAHDGHFRAGTGGEPLELVEGRAGADVRHGWRGRHVRAFHRAFLCARHTDGGDAACHHGRAGAVGHHVRAMHLARAETAAYCPILQEDTPELN